VSTGSVSEKKSRMAQICGPAERITSLPSPRQLVRAIACDRFHRQWSLLRFAPLARPSGIAAGKSLLEAGLSDIAIFDNVAQKIDGLIGPREDFARYGHRADCRSSEMRIFPPGGC
jgi:hypothetical protein